MGRPFFVWRKLPGRASTADDEIVACEADIRAAQLNAELADGRYVSSSREQDEAGRAVRAILAR